MRVYVVVSGLYEDQAVEGVYATPGAAMEAHPVTRAARPRGAWNIERGGGWQRHDDETWTNGLDWQDAKQIQGHDVVGG